MFNDDYKVSAKAAKRTQAIVNAAIANYNESIKAPAEPKYKSNYQSEANFVLENASHHANTLNRYHTFMETVRSTLVTEALYKLFTESVDSKLTESAENRTIMRAIISQYVNENGYFEILDKMKKSSATMCEMYNAIQSSASAILEAVDKKDPSTFVITPAMRDDFFASLDYSDSEAISDAIKNRVSDAMQDFITANTKSHEDINATLKDAQEKITNTPESNTAMRESYEMRAKRKVLEIRSAPKNVFHAMVSAMCESVLRNQTEYAEFMENGHLNVDKVVDRTSLMYTFIEMVNTSRLENVDANYIESLISNLKK